MGAVCEVWMTDIAIASERIALALRTGCFDHAT